MLTGIARRYRFLDERDDFRRGTLAPFFLASLRPIAIACFRLFTLRPEPLFSVPFFRRRIVDSTFLEADRPYFAITPLSPCSLHLPIVSLARLSLFMRVTTSGSLQRESCRTRREKHTSRQGSEDGT